MYRDYQFRQNMFHRYRPMELTTYLDKLLESVGSHIFIGDDLKRAFQERVRQAVIRGWTVGYGVTPPPHGNSQPVQDLSAGMLNTSTGTGASKQGDESARIGDGDGEADKATPMLVDLTEDLAGEAIANVSKDLRGMYVHAVLSCLPVRSRVVRHAVGLGWVPWFLALCLESGALYKMCR